MSDKALDEMRLFDALTDAGASPWALPPEPHCAGVSEHASSLFYTVSEVLRLPPPEVARSIFRRSVCARRLARASVLRGLKLRPALSDALEPGMVGLRKWLPGTSEDWFFPASRRGSGSPQRGCALRTSKFAQEAPGATQTACRLSGADDSEMVRIIRAYNGSDVARDEYGRRQSTRASARRSVRVAPGVPDSSDQWPGVKAAGRPAPVLPAV